MASGNSIDGIEVAETSFNVKSDESKGVKEGSGDEDGKKHNILIISHCISLKCLYVCVLSRHMTTGLPG
jgi:hypothetical protein